jgi:hypothetical protein
VPFFTLLHLGSSPTRAQDQHIGERQRIEPLVDRLNSAQHNDFDREQSGLCLLACGDSCVMSEGAGPPRQSALEVAACVMSLR